MTDAVRIRSAQSPDLPAVMEMYADLAALQAPWRVFTPRASMARDMEAVYRKALKDPQVTLLVADVDGQVVGMAEGTVVRPSLFSEELAVELSSVYVRPSHRGRGIARSLTLHVARFARDHRVERVTLLTFARNEPALQAWSRLGFQPRSCMMTAPVETLLELSDDASEF